MFDKLIPWRSHKTDLAKPRYGEDRMLSQMRDEFDMLWNRFWNDWEMTARGANGGWMQALNVEDEEHEYVVRAELPGFESDDFDIRVSGNTLSLRAERKEEEKGGDGARMQRYGSFYESLVLPSEVDSEKISADYRSGILEVHLPKTEKTEHKRIPVKAV